MRLRFVVVVVVLFVIWSPLLSAAAPKRSAVAVEVTYLGTAGWKIESGDTVILLDPYYSRVPDPADDTRLTPDRAAVRRYAPARADLVLVSHSHWDHLLDAAVVAEETGAQLLGSLSTANYGRASGLAKDRVIPVRGGEDYAFDGFSVRVIPGLHSALYKKHWLDDAVIPEGVKLPMRVDEFHPGGTFDYLIRIGGRQLLFVSSANFIERELEGVRPDVLFVATGLREEVFDYTCRLMTVLGKPRLAFTTHFDDFTVPYEVARAGHAGLVERQKGFVEEVRRCSPRTEVRVPRHLDAVRLP